MKAGDGPMRRRQLDTAPPSCVYACLCWLAGGYCCRCRFMLKIWVFLWTVCI